MNLKQIPYSKIPIDLRLSEQNESVYKNKNPQGLVPALDLGHTILTQSLAIIEYLEEIHPTIPLLPKDPLLKAKIRAFAYAIACDIHPLNNLRVLGYLKDECKISETQKLSWYHHWLKQGFDAIEAMIDKTMPFALTDTPSLADICLIPQIYNALRFEFDMRPYPRSMQIYDFANTLEAFQKATP